MQWYVLAVHIFVMVMMILKPVSKKYNDELWEGLINIE